MPTSFDLIENIDDFSLYDFFVEEIIEFVNERKTQHAVRVFTYRWSASL